MSKSACLKLCLNHQITFLKFLKLFYMNIESMSRSSTAPYQFSNNGLSSKTPRCLICDIARHLYPVLDAVRSAISVSAPRLASAPESFLETNSDFTVVSQRNELIYLPPGITCGLTNKNKNLTGIFNFNATRNIASCTRPCTHFSRCRIMVAHAQLADPADLIAVNAPP